MKVLMLPHQTLLLPLFLAIAYYLPWSIEHGYRTSEVANLQIKIKNIYREQLRDKDFQPEIFSEPEDGYMNKYDCELLLEVSNKFSEHVKFISLPEGEFFENDRKDHIEKAEKFQKTIREYMEANLLKS